MKNQLLKAALTDFDEWLWGHLDDPDFTSEEQAVYRKVGQEFEARFAKYINEK